MTKDKATAIPKDAALKLALDLAIMHHSDDGYAELRLKVRQLAKEALAPTSTQCEVQPEQELEYCVDYHCAGDCGQPHNQQERKAFLVAKPLHRPWVGLTEQEVTAIDKKYYRPMGPKEFAKEIEDALRSKNT